jgi:thioredoxin-dependent peroxiredoxin
MKSFLLAVLAFFSFSAARAEPLEVGAVAPDVTALNQDGEEVRLGDLYRQGTVLVYFYPRSDTPGCTAQACSLRDEYTRLQELGVKVVGVSMDPVDRQKAFQEKHNLPFTLLADTEGKVVEGFGVPTRGRFASRQAFLIKDGKIAWRDLRASTAKQAADVLAALEELNRPRS